MNIARDKLDAAASPERFGPLMMGGLFLGLLRSGALKGPIRTQLYAES